MTDEEIRALRDRVEDIEADLHGPKENRRREASPGLFAEIRSLRGEVGGLRSEVRELSTSRDEAEAVARVRKVIIAAMGVLLTAQIGLMSAMAVWLT